MIEALAVASCLWACWCFVDLLVLANRIERRLDELIAADRRGGKGER